MNTVYCYSLLIILGVVNILGVIYMAPRCPTQSPSIIIGGMLLAGCR